MSADPFSLLYDKIVSILRDKKLNVLSWNSTRNPQADTPSSADFPELQLRPIAHTTLLGASSCETTVARDFNVVVQTETLKAGLLFSQEWRLLCALFHLRFSSALAQLKWNDRNFVQDVVVLNATTGITDPATGRKIEGWASLWTIRVTLSFSPNDLEQALNGSS